MNITTYFYPKFLEFQIMCRRPQMTPAARGPRVWDPCHRLWWETETFCC